MPMNCKLSYLANSLPHPCTCYMLVASTMCSLHLHADHNEVSLSKANAEDSEQTENQSLSSLSDTNRFSLLMQNLVRLIRSKKKQQKTHTDKACVRKVYKSWLS